MGEAQIITHDVYCVVIFWWSIINYMKHVHIPNFREMLIILIMILNMTVKFVSEMLKKTVLDNSKNTAFPLFSLVTLCLLVSISSITFFLWRLVNDNLECVWIRRKPYATDSHRRKVTWIQIIDRNLCFYYSVLISLVICVFVLFV